MCLTLLGSPFGGPGFWGPLRGPLLFPFPFWGSVGFFGFLWVPLGLFLGFLFWFLGVSFAPLFCCLFAFVVSRTWRSLARLKVSSLVSPASGLSAAAFVPCFAFPFLGPFLVPFLFVVPFGFLFGPFLVPFLPFLPFWVLFPFLSLFRFLPLEPLLLLYAGFMRNHLIYHVSYALRLLTFA